MAKKEFIGFCIIFLMAFSIISGCQKNNSQTDSAINKDLKINRVTNENFITTNPKSFLLIIAQTDFNDDELLKTKAALFNAGHKVIVASITKEAATGMRGSLITPDFSISEVNPSDYDYVVVIGGSGVQVLSINEEVLKVVRQAKNVAAICLGPMTLANAGRLSGKRATVFKTINSLNALQKGNATFTNEAITVDGTLLTANGPEQADTFAKMLVQIAN